MAFLGERQRIDYPLIKNWRALDEFQFGIQKTNIETGVVNDQDRLANERQELIDDLRRWVCPLEIRRLFRERLQLREGRHVGG